MRSWVLALLAAVLLHVAILLFGGIFFIKPEGEKKKTIEEVDLVETKTEEKEEEVEPVEQTAEEIEVPEEAPPEMREVVEAAPSLEPTDTVARLDALSLSALENALDPGASGGGGYFSGVSLASGGRIGGTGDPAAAGADESATDAIFDLAELDQKPRLVYQQPPTYPRELRSRKVEGTVFVVFVVDREGKVVNPRVEGATDEAFGMPALEAVRRWRFEPAVVRGEKVQSKLRVPIRFSLSS